MTQEFVIEKNINQLVEQQFPEFFRTDGPVFVEFVKQYYKWLEGVSDKAVLIEGVKVDVEAKQTSVTLHLGLTADFNDYFAAGDKIAIWDEDDDYRIYTIDTVETTEITLTTDNYFSGTELAIGTVINAPNALYHSRRLFDYDDVDNTVNEFIVYFKEKYLKDIQFETQTNTKQLVKHALDIYRSKGTERAADLMFRLVFGVDASFYYPSSDIFKTSDGTWYVPTYLELSLNENSDKFINKQVTGLTSGATAFADSLIRRTVKGKLVDVLYVSSINGNFITGEVINTSDGVLNNSEAPRLVGSLTELEIDVDGVSESYRIGDIVDIESTYGEQAKGRVTAVSNITGIVNFEVPNSGYAYTANADVYISKKVLVLSNVVANQTASYFGLFETVYQPMSNITYISANNSFTAGDNVTTYYANNTVKGTGIIFSVTESNSTSGTLLVGRNSGNLNASRIYTTANAIMANISVHADATASGNVIAYSNSVILTTSNLNGTFIKGETLYQVDASNIAFSSAVLNNYVTGVGSNGTIKAYNLENAILTSNIIYGSESGASAQVEYVSVNMGIIDITNNFRSDAGNRIYGNNLGTTANVTGIGVGSGASFTLSNTLNYSETVSLNTDLITPYLNINLNSTTYGFPGNTSANISWAIANALSFSTLEIGRPARIMNINKGQGYSLAPMVLVFEPLTYIYRKYETVELQVDQNAFYVGELVTQDSVDSRGLVVATNATAGTITVENLRFYSNNFFALSTNSLSYLVGEESGGSANVTGIVETTVGSTFDFMGGNFSVDASTQSGNGAVTAIKIIDSGFGFLDEEQVIFSKEGLLDGTATAVLQTNGKSLGRYKQKGGFLSDQKKLYDGYYYQDFSYEIRSSVPLTKYEDMLKKILHVAGTKYFGAYVKTSELNVELTPESIITVS